MHTIVNTTPADIEAVHQFFEYSIEYQTRNGYPDWKNYDRDAIARDIGNGNQFKIIVDDKIAIVFSVAYADKIIWRHWDKRDSIFLHRIVVNPDFKGQKLFGKVLEWSIDHCRQKKLKFVRMDTWSANPRIIDYYQSFGFKLVEYFTTPDTEELPVHNRKLGLALLEYPVS